MKRSPGLFAALFLLVFVAGAEAQSTSQRSSSAPAATATDQRLQLPRINPRDLLPRNWFGAGDTTPPNPAPATTTPSESRDSASGGSGSARSRLLRDMRSTDVAIDLAPSSVRRPPARAGSALSANPPSVIAESGSSPGTNARLARSIAAEAADALVGAPTQPLAKPAETTPITPLEESGTVADADVSHESLLPFGDIEGPTPTEQNDLPLAEEAVEANLFDEDAAEATPLAEAPSDEPAPLESDALSPVAESQAGRLSVATRPEATTKLPMFIGDRYGSSGGPSQGGPTLVTKPKTPATDSQAAGPTSFGKPATPLKASPYPSATAPSEDDNLLLTQRMPVLVSKVSGPRTIVVGREVTYRVHLANRGDVTADNVVTRITIPDGAEVVGKKAAQGALDADDAPGQLVWRTGRLAEGQVVSLDLQLVARTGKPIQLGVAHSHDPVDGSTLVQVQEPKLALTMVGPDEVLYGKPQTFRLTIANPGTGVAERVTLFLTPPGGEMSTRTSHDFGDIAAGDERTVEIELTAREAGQLAVNASAKATGDVHAAVTKEVFCRKAELVLDWRGPADRYAGAPALYFLRVRNPGTATAPGVVMNVDLPEGFEVQPGGQTPTVENGRLTFSVGSLAAGDERFFELRGVLRKAGANALELTAAASDETRAEPVTATTEVVALADLKLDVLDPKGPVATNQEVAYEIRVTNRGSNAAHDVRVIGLFSEGIEPHHVDGAMCQINDGRVAFETIGVMAAGEERVFTIHARAHTEGTHLFRAEVLCRDLDIKLAAEETTRFFEDEAIDVAGDGYPSGGMSPVFPR